MLFTTAVANLIIPRYIILIYGSEVNGLTTSISRILTIVNLIQAGLGSSVTYMMYKPIGDEDRVELASIIGSARKVYQRISITVSIIGTIASFVFAYVLKTDLKRDAVLIASLITCIDSAAGTFFTAVPGIFLNAKQDGYLISRISIICNFIGYALRILIIIFKPHYLTLFCANIIISLINIVAVNNCYRRRYEPYRPTEKECSLIHSVPIGGVSYAAANEAAHAVINGSVTVIISTIAGLKASSVFGVYLIAISCLNTVSNAIYSAVVPGYGSVAAENDMEKTNRIFEIYQFLLYALNALMYMCAAYLMLPFVQLYTAGVTDTEYSNKLLMIFVLMYGITSMSRIPYNNTVYVRGLFKETYLQPVICAAISLVLMVILTKIDYTYTVLGPVFFYIMNTMYQHYKLPKIFPGFDNSRFWNHLMLIVVGVSISVTAYCIHPVVLPSFLSWIACAVVTGIISSVVLLMLMLFFDRKSMMLTADYLRERLLSKKENNNGYSGS